MATAAEARRGAFVRQQNEARARQARLAGGVVRDILEAMGPLADAPSIPDAKRPERKRDWIFIDGSRDEDQFWSRIRVRTILDVVAEHFNVSLIDLVSPRRNAKITFARQIAMYLAHRVTDRSLPEIGRAIGGRDHTTVLHGVRKITAQIKTDPAIAADVEALRLKLIGGEL